MIMKFFTALIASLIFSSTFSFAQTGSESEAKEMQKCFIALTDLNPINGSQYYLDNKQDFQRSYNLTRHKESFINSLHNEVVLRDTKNSSGAFYVFLQGKIYAVKDAASNNEKKSFYVRAHGTTDKKYKLYVSANKNPTGGDDIMLSYSPGVLTYKHVRLKQVINTTGAVTLLSERINNILIGFPTNYEYELTNNQADIDGRIARQIDEHPEFAEQFKNDLKQTIERQNKILDSSFYVDIVQNGCGGISDLTIKRSLTYAIDEGTKAAKKIKDQNPNPTKN